MNGLVTSLQILVSTVLIVTWTYNLNRATTFVGEDAMSMKEEFAVYDLPVWSVYVVGGLKIIGSIFLLMVLSSSVVILLSSAPQGY